MNTQEKQQAEPGHQGRTPGWQYSTHQDQRNVMNRHLGLDSCASMYAKRSTQGYGSVMFNIPWIFGWKKEAFMYPVSKLLQVLLPIPLLAPEKKVEKKIRETRMVPYFPAIGERAAVESISPLAAEEPATLLLPQVRSCPSYTGRNGDPHLSSLWAEILDYK